MIPSNTDAAGSTSGFSVIRTFKGRLSRGPVGTPTDAQPPPAYLQPDQIACCKAHTKDPYQTLADLLSRQPPINQCHHEAHLPSPQARSRSNQSYMPVRRPSLLKMHTSFPSVKETNVNNPSSKPRDPACHLMTVVEDLLIQNSVGNWSLFHCLNQEFDLKLP